MKRHTTVYGNWEIDVWYAAGWRACIYPAGRVRRDGWTLPGVYRSREEALEWAQARCRMNDDPAPVVSPDRTKPEGLKWWEAEARKRRAMKEATSHD